ASSNRSNNKCCCYRISYFPLVLDFSYLVQTRRRKHPRRPLKPLLSEVCGVLICTLNYVLMQS
uniref:Uncharacterized protein n=1 Tax=Aegilops tauschii subsp. strangulata TaxID=200361 RepID=A0A453PS54_AEGTS